MALRKFIPSNDSQPPAVVKKPLNFSIKIRENPRFVDTGLVRDVDVDLREVYFLIMHFLSSGPCQRTCGQFWNELLENRLLPRRYHAWYSRTNVRSGDENDDGVSFPLNYNMLTERYPHVAKDHLVKLLKQLILSRAPPSRGMFGGNAPNASDVPTLMGSGSFSLLSNDRDKVNKEIQKPPLYMRWPHMKVDQFRGLCLREIGGGFARHHRAPSIRTSCYAIAQPSTMFQKMHHVKKLRGHRYAVYCATLDRSGRYVITGSDDRLVKIWSMETAYCLASCRGHEGDITDLAVSSNNAVVASSSNDCIIRVWRLPDGQPISVLRGHTGAVTAITFNPRPGFVYQLLSSSDDGTCRIWDARSSQLNPRVYVPRPSDGIAGRNNGTALGVGVQSHQIFCCAFNSSGTIFVTGSSDTLARVWSASKPSPDDGDQPNHEIDVLSGHENDVNYVQFSGCAMTSRFMTSDTLKEENVPKFKNSWFTHDNIVTCSRDGSAIIWSPRSRRSNAKACRWVRAYHLKVPPPPMPPQPLRGGPRQRILPTPRGVNMIIWSLDNRFVLAAIMDCRICVWNASDGSLVHSLTGHSESTYVLDVHPFNPRIAMSAGYDGRTIVWDIWEGKPIKIHEISRFKLVDGKFSPDGTSIILSDDVGQLYIVNTGQGESQKDARYDQFFLGDYRPLMQDTYGNVIDQETQLSTFRRNMQDLLCDSGMIPYPEPYQSSFQKKRLGALGHEWNPNSQTLATGPDFTVDPEFQMLPLADLDIMAEPVPEFADIMDWEPEIEIHSDDNDSEYNVPEDYVSGGDQGNVSASSSDEDSRGSEDDGDTDGDDDDGQLDSLRRSKRKKKKSETEVMTSSGRRVKRRNLDEAEGNSLRNNRARKLKTGRKASRKKSSKSKSKSRPKRAAALNALNLFSKITGTSTEGEEDEEGSEVETSESGSDLQDSDIESNISDKYTQTEQRRRLKGKEISLNDSEEFVEPDSQVSTENRARLVLKLPNKIRDRAIPESDKHDDFAGPSSKAPQENGCEDSKQTFEDKHVRNGNSEGGQLDKVENLNLTGSYISGKIKWGGIRPRSGKRRRLSGDLSGRIMTVGDAVNLFSDSQDGVGNERVFGTGGETSKSHDVADDGQKCNFLPENTGNPQNVSRGPEMESPATKDEKGTCNNSLHDSTVPEDATTNGVDSNQRDTGASKDSTSPVKDSGEPRARSDKMFSVVYRRSKHKGTSNLSGIASSSSDQKHPSVELDSCEGPSNGSKKPSMSISDHMAEDDNTKLNLEPESSSGCKLNVEPESSSGYKLRNALNSSGNREKSSRFLHEEWGSSSKVTIGLRSTRNRRGNYNNINEMSPMESRKPNKSSRKGMWLMLSTHEEGSRYIPQLGDEVAYLRQGHQEYLEHNRCRETPPWTSTKGNVRDVEFCRVEKLDYSSLPGSGESCCKMTLVFVDPTSCVYLKSFKMTLPEMMGFPDFLVEKTRYQASIQRNWTHRDKCKVWWKNDGEEDGSWWDGRILTVKPKSPDFMDSPWERYTVQYKSDPAETHLHSPWELFDVDTLWENLHIDEESKFSVQSSFAKLEKSSKPPQDRFAVIKLRQLSQKTNFTNRFPVPISLDLIECRLENDYYRSLEALKHDFEVMLSNAEQYLGNKSDFTAKLKRFRDWLEKTFPSS